MPSDLKQRFSIDTDTTYGNLMSSIPHHIVQIHHFLNDLSINSCKCTRRTLNESQSKRYFFLKEIFTLYSYIVYSFRQEGECVPNISYYTFNVNQVTLLTGWWTIITRIRELTVNWCSFRCWRQCLIGLYLGNSKVGAEEKILSQDQLSELLLTQLLHRMYILRGATSCASSS